MGYLSDFKRFEFLDDPTIVECSAEILDFGYNYQFAMDGEKSGRFLGKI